MAWIVELIGWEIIVVTFFRESGRVATTTAMKSTPSVCGVERLRATIAVLDFMRHGSSSSLRSLARLGSTLPVYGMS